MSEVHQSKYLDRVVVDIEEFSIFQSLLTLLPRGRTIKAFGTAYNYPETENVVGKIPATARARGVSNVGYSVDRHQGRWEGIKLNDISPKCRLNWLRGD